MLLVMCPISSIWASIPLAALLSAPIMIRLPSSTSDIGDGLAVDFLISLDRLHVRLVGACRLDQPRHLAHRVDVRAFDEALVQARRQPAVAHVFRIGVAVET